MNTSQAKTKEWNEAQASEAAIKKLHEAQAKDVRFDSERMHIDLTDGRTISVPLSWYPRLFYATEQQRQQWYLSGDGIGIHWEEVDEDLSVRSMLLGNRAPAATPPFRSLEIPPHELRLPEDEEAPVGSSRPARRRSRVPSAHSNADKRSA